MYYEYNDFSRLTAVYSPKDSRPETPAVRYMYYTPKRKEKKRWYTIMENKVLFEADDTIVMIWTMQKTGLTNSI